MKIIKLSPSFQLNKTYLFNEKRKFEEINALKQKTWFQEFLPFSQDLPIINAFIFPVLKDSFLRSRIYIFKKREKKSTDESSQFQ